MKQKILTLSLGVAVIFCAVNAAQAQTATANCAPHESVVEQLADKYGETRQSFGLAQNSQVIEVFASLETGTWTIIVTRPTGISCMVAAGEHFEQVDVSENSAALGDPA